ncbi:MAG: hypothetical protein LBC40_05870 [Dysgonamonadaceae bacterium]|nr:hypothetical protein [Dysgonamonadaceae bacterium]
MMNTAILAMMFLPVAPSAQNSYALLDGSLYDVVSVWNHKKKPQAKEAHWAGLSFAYSYLTDLPANVSLNAERSYSISWNIEDWEMPIHRHWLLVSGLGFDWSRWHFHDNTSLRNTNGYTGFFTDNRDLNDSKLLVYYGKIPLTIEYQTTILGKLFFVQGGVEGLLKLYSKSQIELQNNGSHYREDFRDLRITPLNMRLYLGLGTKSASIFGYYQPFSMFWHGHSPELRSFGIGILLN